MNLSQGYRTQKKYISKERRHTKLKYRLSMKIYLCAIVHYLPKKIILNENPVISVEIMTNHRYFHLGFTKKI